MGQIIVDISSILKLLLYACVVCCKDVFASLVKHNIPATVFHSLTVMAAQGPSLVSKRFLLSDFHSSILVVVGKDCLRRAIQSSDCAELD